MSKIRPIRIEGDVALVPLTRGLEAIIDASDVPLVAAWNWCAFPGWRTFYGFRSSGPRGSKVHYRIHRVILNAADGVLVDHINGNGLDNRRSNLRLATHADNARNKRLRRDSSTGLKGVSLCKYGRWYAQIMVHGQNIWLGSHETPEAAHAAYCAAASKYFGEFARSA